MSEIEFRYWSSCHLMIVSEVMTGITIAVQWHPLLMQHIQCSQTLITFYMLYHNASLPDRSGETTALRNSIIASVHLTQYENLARPRVRVA